MWFSGNSSFITGKISEINCEIKSKEEFVLNLVKVQEEERKRIASITFELVDNLLKITATDDGIGFDTERLKSIDKEKHFGILGIKERVELLNGSFNIASTLKKGTNITISIPISTA